MSGVDRGRTMVLALPCRCREQLIATSTVVVLLMAAIGGNLFPRFFMPEALQAAGRVTFNAWAHDGYQKVFWYDAPPQMLEQAAGGVYLEVTSR